MDDLKEQLKELLIDTTTLLIGKYVNRTPGNPTLLEVSEELSVLREVTDYISNPDMKLVFDNISGAKFTLSQPSEPMRITTVHMIIVITKDVITGCCNFRMDKITYYSKKPYQWVFRGRKTIEEVRSFLNMEKLGFFRKLSLIDDLKAGLIFKEGV